MLAYLIRRFAQMLLTLFIVSIISFLIVALAPGDPYASVLDPETKPADIERQRDKGGYDQPVVQKYLKFYGDFFADLHAVITDREGYDWHLVSDKTKEAVIPTMWRKMKVTLPLVIVGMIVFWTLSFPIGIYSALRRGSIQDQIITVLAYALIAIPSFWLALLVIGFVTNTMGKPIVSPSTLGVQLTGAKGFMDATWHTAVPAIISAFGGVAVLTRYVKGQMLEVLGQDYIRTAKAKGLDSDSIHYKHAFRNASLPFITMIANVLPALFGGSIVIEAIYGWPGLGRWIFEAAFTKDIFVVVTALFVSSALTLMGILVSDILYSVADPRIKLA